MHVLVHVAIVLCYVLCPMYSVIFMCNSTAALHVREHVPAQVLVLVLVCG